jgi:predicted 3-demethylubiquinone-9 3-methyltransferase (glyoxalase superfamily)
MQHNFTPNLWFDGNAEEAANFYCSIFPNSRIGQITRYTPNNPHGIEGSVMTIDWYLDDHRFTGINGGPQFPFTTAVSFMYECKDQQEIDRVWDALGKDGGQVIECGWLSDKFGLQWQITPRIMQDMVRDGNAAQLDAVMKLVLTMKKIEIAPLVAAYEAAA